MAPRARPKCQICTTVESKYSCPACLVVYCSVACNKTHKAACAGQQAKAAEDSGSAPGIAATPLLSSLAASDPAAAPDVQDKTATDVDAPVDSDPALEPDLAVPEAPPPLRPLTSLRWPYIPEESVYADPLKRDDPKALQLPQYEAIATSPAVRKALASPELRDLLRRLDALRGPEREDALQAALGVAPGQQAFALQGAAAAAPPSRGYAEEEMKLLRTLAEAVEGTVRGGKEETLGLDWDA